MNRQKALIVSMALLCSLVAVGVAWADGTPTISWWVVGGGGGHAEAAPYSLDDTIGQPVVGWVSQSSYDLCAGFWCLVAAEYRVYLPLVLRNY